MHPITQPRSDTAKPSFCAFEGRPILSDVESPKPKTASPKLSYWQLLLLPLGLILIDTTWGKGSFRSPGLLVKNASFGYLNFGTV